jgi:hypothetical protein
MAAQLEEFSLRQNSDLRVSLYQMLERDSQQKIAHPDIARLGTLSQT